MYKYLILNIVFLGIAGLIYSATPTRTSKIRRRNDRYILWFILLSLMVIFDSYLTILPIVTYNLNATLGLQLGSIPVEDFAYLIAAIVLAPRLYDFFSNKTPE